MTQSDTNGAEPTNAAPTSKYERFSMRVLPRSAIKGAPYNPRVISNAARARLRRGIEENGLIQPVIWNETTGNLVGGHQRLAILDDLEGGADYQIQVAAIRVPLGREKRLNVLLNNDATMGSWDERKLLEIFSEAADGTESDGAPDEKAPIDFDAFGFSANQAEYFGNLLSEQEAENAAVVAAMTGAAEFEAEMLATDAGGVKPDVQAAKLARKQAFESKVDGLLVPMRPDEWKLKSDEEKRDFDRQRTAYREETFDYTSVKIVFVSPESRRAFLVRLGVTGRSLTSEVIHESEFGEQANDATPSAEGPKIGGDDGE